MNISAFERVHIHASIHNQTCVQHTHRIHQIYPAFDLVNQTIKFNSPPPLERRANNAHFIETQKNSYILANRNGVTICELRSGDNRLLMKFGVTGSRRALRLRYSERAALRYCITVLPFTAGMIDLLASLGRRETRPGTN